MEHNQNYLFSQLEEFAGGDYSMEQYGKEIVGEHFIVLRHNTKDLVHSYVLTGIQGGEYVYKCIYSDL